MKNHNSINIGFIGDVAFTGIFSKVLIENREVFDNSVKKILNSNDFNVINLEGPLSDGTYTKKGIKVTNPPKAAEILIQNKCNIFNLANNHILDLGKIGLDSTLNLANNVGARAFGLNTINQFGGKTIYIEKNNIKIALVGVLQHYSAYNENDEIIFTNVNDDLVRKEIITAKKNADYVVLNYHGFEEYTFLPIPYKKTLLRKYIDYGADIIIAHHPHVVQGYEKLDDKLIFYSLGNFIFDIPQHTSRKGTDSSIILNINFTKNQIKFTPHFIDVDKNKGKLNVVKKNLSTDNFQKILDYDFKQKWMKECNRLLFVDSEIPLKSNMENDNLLIKKLKYYNRLFRLMKSYYKGKEAYRPILKSALIYKLTNFKIKNN